MTGPFEQQVDQISENLPRRYPGLAYPVAWHPKYRVALNMIRNSRYGQLRGLLSYEQEDYWLWDATYGFHKDVADAFDVDYYEDVIRHDGTLKISSETHLGWMYYKLKKGGVRRYHDIIVPPDYEKVLS